MPRPGRALGGILIAISVVGVVGMLAPSIVAPFMFLPGVAFTAFTQPWRFLTSGLVTDWSGLTHLIFTLLGLYFLGGSLERRWGEGRFLRFCLLSVVVGNLLALAVSPLFEWILGPQRHLFAGPLFGALAAISALAVAWSFEEADSTVRLFFLLPVRGRWLLWITVGFCVLNALSSGTPEGPVAPFGGVVVGVVFASPWARRLYLRAKLAVLRTRSKGLRVEDVLDPEAARRRALRERFRVIEGGADSGRKKPPTDKRFLN